MSAKKPCLIYSYWVRSRFAENSLRLKFTNHNVCCSEKFGIEFGLGLKSRQKLTSPIVTSAGKGYMMGSVCQKPVLMIFCGGVGFGPGRK